ncbi:MAG: hypothetical protein MJ113_05350 [Lachnospiraceae bacterium]|nr:hypothetical protein [Lachnospiraceae bacterium]
MKYFANTFFIIFIFLFVFSFVGCGEGDKKQPGLFEDRLQGALKDKDEYLLITPTRGLFPTAAPTSSPIPTITPRPTSLPSNAYKDFEREKDKLENDEYLLAETHPEIYELGYDKNELKKLEYCLTMANGVYDNSVIKCMNGDIVAYYSNDQIVIYTHDFIKITLFYYYSARSTTDYSVCSFGKQIRDYYDDLLTVLRGVEYYEPDRKYLYKDYTAFLDSIDYTILAAGEIEPENKKSFELYSREGYNSSYHYSMFNTAYLSPFRTRVSEIGKSDNIFYYKYLRYNERGYNENELYSDDSIEIIFDDSFTPDDAMALYDNFLLDGMEMTDLDSEYFTFDGKVTAYTFDLLETPFYLEDTVSLSIRGNKYSLKVDFANEAEFECKNVKNKYSNPVSEEIEYEPLSAEVFISHDSVYARYESGMVLKLLDNNHKEISFPKHPYNVLNNFAFEYGYYGDESEYFITRIDDIICFRRVGLYDADYTLVRKVGDDYYMVNGYKDLSDGIYEWKSPRRISSMYEPFDAFLDNELGAFYYKYYRNNEFTEEEDSKIAESNVNRKFYITYKYFEEYGYAELKKVKMVYDYYVTDNSLVYEYNEHETNNYDTQVGFFVKKATMKKVKFDEEFENVIKRTKLRDDSTFNPLY